MTPATILLVEDNPITRKMVRFALENQGLEVVDAPDGAAALRSFAARPFGLVLQDLVLPDMNGAELVARLRAMPRGAEVPILAVSALSDLESARLTDTGFDGVIRKPVEPSRLLEIVRAHLPAPELDGAKFGTGRRVLVADDDSVQRKLLGFRLAKLGFEIAEAADGAEALELARRDPPDAIVSDVLMPKLDGFALCMEARKDPQLAAIPLLLITNSYIESADRALARRAGADDLMVRTPQLTAVIEALRDRFAGSAPVVVEQLEQDAAVERERMHRVATQLERQVTLNARVARRCALLTAELSVLSGISDALAEQDDFDEALEQVLAACLDAVGFSIGALYLTGGERRRMISFGGSNGWHLEDLEQFFDDTALLDTASGSTIEIPSASVPAERSAALLAGCGAVSALITPLSYRSKPLGALVTGSRVAEPYGEDRQLFAQAVAGQISHALALAEAFAAKHASERAAQQQATVLRSILESMAEGVVVADQSGACIHWNSAASQILGRAFTRGASLAWAGELGVRRSDRVTPVPRDELPLVRAMRGESMDGMELFVNRDGEGVWLSVNARPLRDESGKASGGVIAFRDISQEKAARTQLMVSDRMASIGMLAAGVAHEINNPLTAVVANLEVAARALARLPGNAAGNTDLDALIEEINDAREAADRVRRIVRDLKIFSRAEEDQKDVVEIKRVLDSTIRMAWNEIRHRARLVKQYGDVPLVRANESRLGQVFLNLIVNAAQAIPEGQADRNEIRVTTKRGGEDTVVVEVADTGIGMPPEVLERLFTPFFTTKPVGVGTGLGLMICRRLVDEIGGEIEVRSKVGEGTAFVIRLPGMTSRDHVAVAAQAPSGPAARRGRVLAIDDDKMIVRAIGRVLGSEHDVVTTTSASEALDHIAASEKFDLILCDLMMPVMTGMDFYEELSRVAPNLLDSVVFLTGGAFTSQARAFLDRVSNARIEKPFDFPNLRAVVNSKIR